MHLHPGSTPAPSSPSHPWCLQRPPILFSFPHFSPDISQLSPSPALSPCPPSHSMAPEQPPSSSPTYLPHSLLPASQLTRREENWGSSGPRKQLDQTTCVPVSSRPVQLNLGSHFNGSLTWACNSEECPPSRRHHALFQFQRRTSPAS